jgi:micrococcal nuclease
MGSMAIKLPLIILALILLIGANLGFQWGRNLKAPAGETWTVTRVLSGQAVAAKSNTGATKRIRLLGISAPWKEQQPWDNLARQRLEDLVKGQPITLEFDRQSDFDPKEQENRWQAYLWQGNTLVNAQLVKEGYVLAAADATNRKYQSQLELWQSEARLLELGIWDTLNPMRLDPQDFRRQLLR